MTDHEMPWLRFYGAVPAPIDHPRVTLSQAVAAKAQRMHEAIAWDFFGATARYRQRHDSIGRAAVALAAKHVAERQ
jgi:hypothetical protein